MKQKPEIFLPGGQKKITTPPTKRAKERTHEDKAYTPVIIKRTDAVIRHPDDILEHAIAEGCEQIKRSLLSLILSSIAAGLILGFSVMAVGVVSTLTLSFSEVIIQRIGVALVYPLGFVICIMSGTQLFTEHTATAVYPVLDKRVGTPLLLRLWIVVILGNMVGAFISGALLTWAEPVIQAKVGYVHIVSHLLDYQNSALIASALLAGWLMAQGAWLVLAAQSTIGQILGIYMVTFLIGIGGLHHSIAGMVEVFTALLISDQFSFIQAMRFIGLALLGNLIGGSMFVAMLNYGHIRRTQKETLE